MWARNAFRVITLALHWPIQPEEVAVPPFGEWDDANAASGEKYTGIFNRVRDDRLSPTSSARQPSTTRSEENKVQQVCKSFSTVKLKIQFICSILSFSIMIAHHICKCSYAEIVSSPP